MAIFKLFKKTHFKSCLSLLFCYVLFFSIEAFGDTLHIPSQVGDLQSAIALANDGDTIEMAGGTYGAPVNGFRFENNSKVLTIQAAIGTTVEIVGGGLGGNNLVWFGYETNYNGNRGALTFEGITFSNGYSSENGVAGGVTMLYGAVATFKNCIFEGNLNEAATTGGGAVLLGEKSIGYFFDCYFNSNFASNEGGALEVQTQSKAYVHSSTFTGNRTNLSGHRVSSAGGAIHIGDSILRVSNSRFENNQAGYVAGAIYAIGTYEENWNRPGSAPGADVIISNCTFVGNRAQRDGGNPFLAPTEGGAFHAEDKTLASIYSSRFEKNSAMGGGAVNLYRAIVEVYDSVFLGNYVTGAEAVGQKSLGGTFSVLSNDAYDSTTGFGLYNRPSAELTISNCYVQGRYAEVTTGADVGGCLYVAGDANRLYGQNNVAQSGNSTSNAATVNISDVVFNDCDVATNSIGGSGVGGAIAGDLMNITMQDSIVMNSDATGSNSSGGGIALFNNSKANMQRVTIAKNSAAGFGAGVFVQGADISFSNCNFIKNEFSPQVAEGSSTSYGAALFTAPYDNMDGSRPDIAATGSVTNCIISENVGLSIFDDDRSNGPVNNIVYNGNSIYGTTFGDVVYKNTLSAPMSVAELNSLNVVRNIGISTKKSNSNNTEPIGVPVVAELLAVPNLVYNSNAVGDPAPSTKTYLGYTWSGASSATLNGSPTSQNVGVSSTTTSGQYELIAVGDSTVGSVALVSTAVSPAATLNANPTNINSGEESTLSWAFSGTGLDAAIDQGVIINPALGSVTVKPLTSTAYSLYVVTEEGGAHAVETVSIGAGESVDIFKVKGITFSWPAVLNSAGYSLEIRDRTTGKIIFSGSLIGAASNSVLISLVEGQFTFTVRVCTSANFDPAQCSIHSTMNFDVALTTPTLAPIILSPTQGESFSSSTHTLSWSSVAKEDASQDLFYEIVIEDVVSGTTVLKTAVFSPDTSTIATLPSSSNHRMKVRACQASCGPWSPPADFSINLNSIPTNAPTITSAALNGNNLNVQWTEVAGADLYQFRVVQPTGGPGGSALTVAAKQVSTASASVSVPTGEANLVVQACTGDGCGPFSDKVTIVPGGINPSLPNLGTPLSGSYIDGPVVDFSWSRIPGDNGSNTTYRLFVQDLSRQSTALDIYTHNNFYAAYFIAEGARYDALVIANPGPAQSVGPAIGFNITGLSSNAPTMVQPAHESTIQQGNIQLGWTPVSGATLYEYYIAVQGEGSATVRGVTPGLVVQVPLSANGGLSKNYSGIVRACSAGANCTSGSDIGWGPWSVNGGPGVTNFTVTP